MLFTLSLADVSIEKTFSKQFLRKFKITLFLGFAQTRDSLIGMKLIILTAK
jgi:hypothetical protein